ncbi:MAG: CPBP family intramembrane metalloprotease [Flavobacteriaceae bacterium]|nr:CPBP family intramembrane metalloprotease [Flavobacteriaceae bacterium]
MYNKIFNHSGWLKSLLFVPLILISQILAVMVMSSSGFDMNSLGTEKIDLEFMIILEYIMIFFMIIMLWAIMNYIDKENFIDIGLQVKGRLKDFNFGLFIGLIIMGFAYFFLLLINELVFVKIDFDLYKILLSIVLFIGVSVFEEIIFRGYVLKNLLESFNPFVALFISSLFFSLIHVANPNVTLLGLSNIFLAGIFLGISYVFTKNLWFPIALHFSWNFFQAMFGFKVSGLDSYSIIDFNIVENNSLNGGEFGFESSILSLFIILVSIIFIWRYFKSSTIQKD